MDGSGAGEVASSIFSTHGDATWRRAVTLRFEGYRSVVMLARRLYRLLVEERVCRVASRSLPHCRP